MKKLLHLIIITFTIPSLAQQGKLYFKHITSDDGLPANYVTAITQDHNGFIWVASEGLSRYDGFSFLNLRTHPNDTNSLINNQIKCLLEDKHDRLWVGTQKGLTYLYLNTYKFKRFSNKFKESIGTNWINSLLTLDNETLFIGTSGNGVYIFDEKNEHLKSYRHDPANINSIISNNVKNACKDRKENIWVATDGGLEKFNYRNGKFTHLLEGENIFHVNEDNKGNIIVTITGSSIIYTIDPNSLEIIDTEKLENEYKEKIKLLFFDSNGNRWLNISDIGLFKYNPRNSITEHYVYNRFNPDGINSNYLLTMYEDREGNIWMGTFDGGVNIIEKHRKPFTQVKSNFLSDGLQSNRIRSIFQDRDGDTWVGTWGTLSRFNRNTFAFTHFSNNSADPHSLNDALVVSIADGPPGSLWLGTSSEGINILDKRTGKFTILKSSPEGTSQLSSNYIPVLLNDGNGKMWIGHAFKGIDVYDLRTKQIEHYSHTTDPNSLSDNEVRVLYKDSKENIWIGTIQGLNLYDKKTNTFKRYLNNPNDTSSISGNNISSICEDKYGNFWIGTTNNGVNLLNRRKNTFTVYDESKKYPWYNVRGMLSDKEGNLWISTGNGIFKFDPIRKSFSHYTREDGLNSNEFCIYTSCKTRNDEMLFGTDNGFVLFEPEKIKDNSIVPNVVISGFKLFNQKVTLDSPHSPLTNDITHTHEITLSYKQSVFTLEFVALNYTSPEKDQYAYKMEGFEKNWNYVGNLRNTTYTNLPAGNYIFRVKASNSDDIWNEQGAKLKITILPPPWKTWWAYMIYILLIGIAFIKLRDVTVRRIYEEKAHELDQMKLKLFMNISHEFRTPLTLMLNPLGEIKTSNDIEEIRTSIKVVERSSWKLLNLVNQLLDFRKIDEGKSSLKVMNTDIVFFSKKMIALFEDLSKTKKVELAFESSLPKLEVWMDIDKYEKIINNLLSNAFKFTESGGKITIKISKTMVAPRKSIISKLKGIGTKEYAEVRVCDSGIGLKQEDIKHIFEPFYQVDQSRAGTGIGLNYVKALVELHSGELLVESEFGKGSTFIVRIPLGKEHLKPEQLINTGTKRVDPTDRFDMAAVESLQYDIENMDTYSDNEDEKDYEISGTEQTKQVILIVEDNKTLRKQIRNQLDGSYIVKEATNGIEGCEKAQKMLPDLIISDIMMPKMDGIELCKQIKSDINTSHIPLILLTAKSSIENKIEGFETGADDYIPKPFNMQLLEVRIKNLIQIRRQLKEKYTTSKALESAKEFTTNNLDEAFLEKATQIVIENIEDPDFALSHLLGQLGMSSSSLYKKLQAITGQNPSGFVRTIRLKYAVQLMMQNKLSVKDVSYKCGFNSPAYFVKTFKELYGQTPKEYFESYLKEKSVE